MNNKQRKELLKARLLPINKEIYAFCKKSSYTLKSYDEGIKFRFSLPNGYRIDYFPTTGTYLDPDTRVSIKDSPETFVQHLADQELYYLEFDSVS